MAEMILSGTGREYPTGAKSELSWVLQPQRRLMKYNVLE